MKKPNRRLISIAIGLSALGAAAALTLNGLRDSVVFFYSPSEAHAKALKPGAKARIGGLVETGSLVQKANGEVRFVVADQAGTMPVTYKGLLPDLFREGQGVVTEGELGDDGVFHADRVLAKHDETYMPREVVEALKKSGEWRPEGGRAAGAAVPEMANP